MSANAREAMLAMEAQTASFVIEHWLICMRTIPQGERFVFLLDNYIEGCNCQPRACPSHGTCGIIAARVKRGEVAGLIRK